jgi:acyl phosphate:glycerol-3-phosphate acyltransferase
LAGGTYSADVELAVYIFAAVAAYLLGSVPTGFLVGKARGIDIRQVGSGNIGATNVMRALGTKLGVMVLVADGLKGYAACAWMTDLALRFFETPSTNVELVRIIAGLTAVLGHNYTCWLKFKGGKGIATSAGVLAGLVPWALVIILSLWIVLFVTTRYVSLASVAAAFTLPFATWLTRGSVLMIAVTGAMGALAIYKHRPNIQRLLQGTESRIGWRKREAAQ